MFKFYYWTHDYENDLATSYLLLINREEWKKKSQGLLTWVPVDQTGPKEIILHKTID